MNTLLHRLRVEPLVAALTVLTLIAVFADTGKAQAKPAGSTSAQVSSGLDAVLAQMDSAAAQFRSAEADFTWDQYQKVVNETDTQKGHIYYRRTAKGDMQMAANISAPDQKSLLYADGKIRIYQPRIQQVNEYDAGKNRADVEPFLVLGFGGRGHDLEHQFEIKFDGYEEVDGVKTAKLELTPKSAKVKGMFDRMVVWIDPSRSVSLKQQAFEPSGDYRLAHYTNIKLNTKISDDVFKLHTSGKIKTVKGS